MPRHAGGSDPTQAALGVADGGQPFRIRERGEGGGKLAPRVWSGNQVKLALDATMADGSPVIPRTSETGVTIKDLWTRVQESGCLDGFLEPGQTFDKFSMIYDGTGSVLSKAKIFLKGLESNGFVLGYVEGTGSQDHPELARHFVVAK